MMVGGGEFFRAREFVFVGRPVKRGNLSVSSELVNMLLHVTLVRWWRWNFSGRELVREGAGGKFIGGIRSSVRSEQYTKMAGF